MAKIKTKKERNVEILERRVSEEDRLIAAWTKYGISEKKINDLKEKKNRHATELTVWKNS
jgi:hypothetical protein